MKNRIPDHIRVLGMYYKILWKDDILDGSDNELCGVCCEANGQILLSRHLLKTDDQILLTLLHEITHAVLHNIVVDPFLRDDVDCDFFNEHLTDSISRVLFAIIKDNCHEKTYTPKDKKNHKHTPRKASPRK